MTSSSITTKSKASCMCAPPRASDGATSASTAHASKRYARLSKLDDNRLVIGGAILRVDRNRAQARHQVFGEENIVAAVGRLTFLALVHAKGMRMRLAGMQRFPGIDELRHVGEKRLEHARAQRILGRQVEVAADDRALRVRQRREGTLAVLGD